MEKTQVKTCALVAFSLIAGASQAMAADISARDYVAYSSWEVVPVVGSLGVGLEGRWQVGETLRFRGLGAGGRLAFTARRPSADLVNTATLIHAGLFADWQPFGNDVYVTGGVIASASTIHGEVRNLKDQMKAFGSTAVVTIADPLTRYRVTQNPLQPFAGIGYSHAIDGRMSIDVNLGAAYAGVPDLVVRSDADRLGFTDRQIRREIARARAQASQYQVVPVVRFGFNVKF